MARSYSYRKRDPRVFYQRGLPDAISAQYYRDRKRKRSYGGGPGTSAPLRLGRRVRQKFAPSYTKTQTEKKQQRNVSGVVKHGDNMSSSFTAVGRNMSARDKVIFRKLQGVKTANNNQGLTFSSATGLQNFVTTGMLTTTNLNEIKLAANAGVVTANSVRMFIGHGTLRTVFKNQSNAAGTVIVYDLVARSPLSTDVDTPTEALIKGYTDLGNLPSMTFVGSTPFRSPEFVQNFSVKKIRTVHLEPGQQHSHTFMFKYNRVVDSTKWDNSSTIASIKGLTVFTMLQFYGGIGHETDNTKITYMPLKLDIIQHTQFNYGYLPFTQPVLNSVNQLATAVTDFDFMGEAGDVDANAAQS